MYLIVGLGNPGQDYQKTRHNIGFRVLDFIAQREKKRFSLRVPLYEEMELQWGSKDVFLMKPLTYMNRSGIAVSHAVQRWGLSNLSRLVVVLDDLQLPFGTIRIRPKGSDGGQKGLRSVIEHLGSQDFPRMRLGIGNHYQDATEYVLSPFTPEEEKNLPLILEAASQALKVLVQESIDQAMTRYNKQVLDSIK